MPVYFPISYLKEEERKRIIEEAVRIGYSIGKQYIKAPELVDRPAKPADFGLSGNSFTWSGTTDSNGVLTIVDETLDDDEVIVIYGLASKSTSPTINAITFETGSEKIADFFFEDMYVQDVPEIIFDKPIVYSPKSRMVIKITSTSTSASISEELILKAVVIEKAGKNISKPK